MLFYDAHNHLQHPALPAEAVALGVSQCAGVIVNGTHEGDWEAVANLAHRYPQVYAAYGIHPWEVDHATPHWEAALMEYLAADPTASVGEIGLDRWKTRANFELQDRLFRRQLAIAREAARPVTIHCLQAWGALMETLRREPLPERGFLLHSYSGPGELVGELADLGAYFSFSGYFLNPAKSAKREPFRLVPQERLLIETDAPSMPLPPERTRHPLPPGPDGERLNHPANLVAVYEGVAEWLEQPPPKLAAQVAMNFAALLGSPTPRAK